MSDLKDHIQSILFKYNNEHSAELIIKHYLEDTRGFVTDIIIALGYHKVFEPYEINKEEFNTKRDWCIDDYGDTVLAVNQKDAHKTLNFLYLICYLPRNFPNGERCRVECFEDLIDVLCMVNPIWLIDTHIYVFSDLFNHRRHPHDKYKIDGDTEEIRRKLEEIL